MAGADWLRVGEGEITLAVRVTPNARADAFAGIREGAGGAALSLKVRAVPEDGRANRAVEALIAKRLKVPKSDVTVASGTTSRLKTIKVAGDAAALAARAADLGNDP